MQNKISGVTKRNICSPPAAESETRPKTGKCSKVFLIEKFLVLAMIWMKTAYSVLNNIHSLEGK
jgi:hypothetical protein